MTKHDAHHFMSNAEWRDWLMARAELAAQRAKPEPNSDSQGAPRKIKKATPTQLAMDLLRAAEEGDLSKIEPLLLLGANPNARERAMRRRSAVEIALAGGSPLAALALMRAGGWGAPRFRADLESQKFDEQVARGELSGEMLQAAIGHTIDVFFASAPSSWAHLMAAAQICRSALPSGAPSAAALIRRAASLGRWDMVGDAMASGEPFDADCWNVAMTRLLNPYCGASVEMLGRLSSVIANEAALDCMPSGAAPALFSLAIRQGSAPLLESLLNARLRPSPDWTIQLDQNILHPSRKLFRTTGEPQDPYKLPVPLVVACSLEAEAHELFKLAASCPPAVAAARLGEVSPWILAPLAIGRLIELDELGVSINALDSRGNCIFHAWAQMDVLPRSGWATLGRKRPELFSLRNSRGERGADIMASKLSVSGAQEFFASLARMESREIRQAVGPAPSKKAGGSKPRPRL